MSAIERTIYHLLPSLHSFSPQRCSFHATAYLVERKTHFQSMEVPLELPYMSLMYRESSHFTRRFGIQGFLAPSKHGKMSDAKKKSTKNHVPKLCFTLVQQGCTHAKYNSLVIEINYSIEHWNAFSREIERRCWQCACRIVYKDNANCSYAKDNFHTLMQISDCFRLQQCQN